MKLVLCKATMCEHNNSHKQEDVGECTMSNIILEVSTDNRIECSCYKEMKKAIVGNHTSSVDKSIVFNKKDWQNKDANNKRPSVTFCDGGGCNCQK